MNLITIKIHSLIREMTGKGPSQGLETKDDPFDNINNVFDRNTKCT